jgi:UDP-glucuronate 4-epimerase
MNKKILITGCAGFIGFSLINKINKNNKVYGIDNIQNKKPLKISKDRLNLLKKKKNFKFLNLDISDYEKLNSFFKKNKIDIVINLAAVAGVRNSIKNPGKYFKNNILGFYNIYILAVKYKIKLFIFGSSSSVYGDKKDKSSNNPVSFYASTKKCNEIISHSFVNFSKMKVVGLRFFTVYGPWGRPDMAVYKFTKNIYKKKTIKVFNYGNHGRDFSYIDDVVKSIILISNSPSKLKKYQIFDIGKGKTDKLINLLKYLKISTKNKILSKKISQQPGDVLETKADMNKFKGIFKYKPQTSLREGIDKFVKWYREYHRSN